MQNNIHQFRSFFYLLGVSVFLFLFNLIELPEPKTDDTRNRSVHLIFEDSLQTTWLQEDEQPAQPVTDFLFGKKNDLKEAQKNVQVDTVYVEIIKESPKRASNIAFSVQSKDQNISWDSIVQFANQKKRMHKSRPVIRYYVKPEDKNKVYRLREYGYYIHERNSGKLNNYSSNVINYGDSVNRSDLMLVAYILIKQGVAIKAIERSKYHADWKYKSIEIGTDTTLENAASISISELPNLIP